MMNLGRLKAIIAPVFLRLVRPRLPVYESFERALADTKGYEDPDIIQMVSEKTQALQRALLEGGAPPRCEDRQTAQDMLALCYASGGNWYLREPPWRTWANGSTPFRIPGGNAENVRWRR
jgi:hypothetical protein